MTDEIRAAAERLISEIEQYAAECGRAVEARGFNRDALTVASYALEAGQETARYRVEAHRLHVTELMVSARERVQIPETEDCPRCAALSMPGGPESSGGAHS